MTQIVYTDGACRGNQSDINIGAWGFVLVGDGYGQDRVFSGADINVTNNQMEMIAVIEALKILDMDKEQDIEIHSDSAYVVNCFKQKWYEGWRRKGWRNSKKQPVANRELWEQMLSLVEGRVGQVEWVKVKGHSGDKYNEVADTLCNEAMDRLEV